MTTVPDFPPRGNPEVDLAALLAQLERPSWSSTVERYRNNALDTEIELNDAEAAAALVLARVDRARQQHIRALKALRDAIDARLGFDEEGDDL